MERNKQIQLSKSLSWLLRHGAHQERLPVGSDGFINVEHILENKRFKGKCSIMDIEHIVATDLKNRYALRNNAVDGKLEIRANQGHSIACINDLELTPIKSSADLPNNWVVHGTYYKSLAAIKKTGLSRMSRVHIHFSPYNVGDHRTTSGIRGNAEVLVYVDVDKAIAGGVKFFQSANNVILTEGNSSGIVEPKYFLKIKDAKTGLGFS